MKNLTRIGIVGFGGRGVGAFGKLFSSQFSDRAHIVAIADTNPERAAAGMEYLGIEADIHEDYRDLLARDDVDAVVITTPDYLHEEIAMAAIRHGKHLLVDKPLAITGEGCLKIMSAAARAQRLAYMGFNLRHDPVLKRMHSLVEAGSLGRLFAMHAVEYYDGGRTYMSRWNRLRKFSGGLFIHKGSHDFDVINWFMKPARPVRVSCCANVFSLKADNLPFERREGIDPGPTCSECAYREQCPDACPIPAPDALAEAADNPQKQAQNRMFSAETAQRDGYRKDLCMYLSDKDTHDHGMAMVEYDNGAIAMHTECFVTPKGGRHYRLDGTAGHMESALHDNRIDLLPRWSKDRTTYRLQRGEGGHGGSDPVMCGDFLACLQTGREPMASLSDGAWSVAIGQACELARTERRVVEIAEVLDVKHPLLHQNR